MSSDATAAPKGKRRPAEPVSVSEFTVTLPGVMSAEREDLRLGVHTKAVEGEGLRITCLKKSGRLIGWNRLQNTPPEQVQVGDMLVSVNGKRSLINVMVSVLEQPQGRGDNLQLVFQRPVYPERLKNILVIGGYDGLSYYGETELWDEDGHGFEDGPRLRVHRWGAAALPIPGHSLVLVAGGFDGSEHQATTEVLNTKCTNSAMQAEDHGFQMGPRMLAPRLGCSMVQLDARRVLVIGGYGLDSTEVLDLETMEFQPGPRLLAPRACCAAVVLEDGRLLVAGGFDRVGTTSSTEVLDLGAEGSLTDSAGFPRGGLELLRFQPGPEMATRRAGCAASQLDRRRVLVLGGTDGGAELSSTELLLVEKMEFRPGPAMAFPRCGACVAPRLRGKLLVAGGRGRKGHSSTEVLDIGAMAFRQGPEMRCSRAFGAAVAYASYDPESDSDSN